MALVSYVISDSSEDEDDQNGVYQNVDPSLYSSQIHSKEAGFSSFFFSPSTEAIGESMDHDFEVNSDIRYIQGCSTTSDPGLQTSVAADDIQTPTTADADTSCSAPTNDTPALERPSTFLNADDLFKLCGSQGKHLSSKDISLIEIDGSKLVNSSELKTNNVKSLTYDYNALYRQHKFKSTRRERTKHQITYLVEHAKFFEREVTNYPKNSKISQKRYGF